MSILSYAIACTSDFLYQCPSKACLARPRSAIEQNIHRFVAGSQHPFQNAPVFFRQISEIVPWQCLLRILCEKAACQRLVRQSIEKCKQVTIDIHVIVQAPQAAQWLIRRDAVQHTVFADIQAFCHHKHIV